jgi:undecaprenyl phosphate N,N'-diacetylbacillosamine 1-phosphate transferase
LYQSIVKPFFDKATALVILILAVPLLIPVMILLFVGNEGKIWFRQARPGYKGSIFYVQKFKTMNDKKDVRGNLLPDKDRLTGIGAFVRKTSLDELPQLINVLKGEMSIIGPRPLLVEYLSLYNNDQSRRHDVKPGITGWAQVNGRNAISWQRKFELDVWYVDHISFFVDLKILFLTVIKIFKAEGINSEGSATIEKFKGND